MQSDYSELVVEGRCRLASHEQLSDLMTTNQITPKLSTAATPCQTQGEATGRAGNGISNSGISSLEGYANKTFD